MDKLIENIKNLLGGGVKSTSSNNNQSSSWAGAVAKWVPWVNTSVPVPLQLVRQVAASAVQAVQKPQPTIPNPVDINLNINNLVPVPTVTWAGSVNFELPKLPTPKITEIMKTPSTFNSKLDKIGVNVPDTQLNRLMIEANEKWLYDWDNSNDFMVWSKSLKNNYEKWGELDRYTNTRKDNSFGSHLKESLSQFASPFKDIGMATRWLTNLITFWKADLEIPEDYKPGAKILLEPIKEIAWALWIGWGGYISNIVSGRADAKRAYAQKIWAFHGAQENQLATQLNSGTHNIIDTAVKSIYGKSANQLTGLSYLQKDDLMRTTAMYQWVYENTMRPWLSSMNNAILQAESRWDSTRAEELKKHVKYVESNIQTKLSDLLTRISKAQWQWLGLNSSQWQMVDEVKKMWYESLNDYMVSWLSYFDSDIPVQLEKNNILSKIWWVVWEVWDIIRPLNPAIWTLANSIGSLTQMSLWWTRKDFLNNDAAFTTTNDQWQNPLWWERGWYLRASINTLGNIIAPPTQTMNRLFGSRIAWEWNAQANRMWFSNQLASADLSGISGRSLSTGKKSIWETLFEFSTQVTDKGIDAAPTIVEAFYFGPKSAITIANNIKNINTASKVLGSVNKWNMVKDIMVGVGKNVAIETWINARINSTLNGRAEYDTFVWDMLWSMIWIWTELVSPLKIYRNLSDMQEVVNSMSRRQWAIDAIQKWEFTNWAEANKASYTIPESELPKVEINESSLKSLENMHQIARWYIDATQKWYADEIAKLSIDAEKNADAIRDVIAKRDEFNKSVKLWIATTSTDFLHKLAKWDTLPQAEQMKFMQILSMADNKNASYLDMINLINGQKDDAQRELFLSSWLNTNKSRDLMTTDWGLATGSFQRVSGLDPSRNKFTIDELDIAKNKVSNNSVYSDFFDKEWGEFINFDHVPWQWYRINEEWLSKLNAVSTSNNILDVYNTPEPRQDIIDKLTSDENRAVTWLSDEEITRLKETNSISSLIDELNKFIPCVR